jgi:hypothetical protein
MSDLTPVQKYHRCELDNREREIAKLQSKIYKLQDQLETAKDARASVQARLELSADEQAGGYLQWYDNTLAPLVANSYNSFVHKCFVQCGLGHVPSIVFRGDHDKIALLAQWLDQQKFDYTREQNAIRSIKPPVTHAAIVDHTEIRVCYVHISQAQ